MHPPGDDLGGPPARAPTLRLCFSSTLEHLHYRGPRLLRVPEHLTAPAPQLALSPAREGSRP